MKTLSRMLLAALLLAIPFAGSLRAADEAPQYEGIPSYSVTRLKIFEGTVWVRTPDSGEWEEFSNNSPIPDPERARLSVPEDSEAELQFHGGQFMLLTGGTELDLGRLEDDLTVFRLRSGEIRFDLPEQDFSPVRVQVPADARVEFPVPGKYWLIAPEGEDPRLVVRAGEATVTTGGGQRTVRRGEEARIGQDLRVGPYAGSPEGAVAEEPKLTNEEQEAGVPPAAATELRDYGEWVYSTEYGYVWRPRVAPGWTPYYYGRWTWISPYGWTWISFEPWGWYPYHYGYWYTDPVFGWVWYPYHSFVSVSFVFGHYRYPHYHRRAYFVPASVRFVGYGSGVRWVPLRPGERIRRVRFTRADRRLVRWERRLPARTVYVREKGPKGSVWTDWRTVREERRRPVATKTPDRRRAVGDRNPPRVERRERISREKREESRERPERFVPGTVSPDRKEQTSRERRGEVRERSERPDPGTVSPGRERIRERPANPLPRRMDRVDRPERESRRPPAQRNYPTVRRENVRARPEPSVARPMRVDRGERPSAPAETFREESGNRNTRGDRFPSESGGWGRGSGGWDRGGGSRRAR